MLTPNICVSGGRGSDDSFKGAKGAWSDNANHMWRKDKSVRLFTTNIDLNNWDDAGQLSSSGDLSGGVEVLVQSADGKRKYETWIFYPEKGREGRYTWVADLCQYINKSSLFIRAGKKDENKQLFECLGSSWANKFWIPVGSKLKVNYKVIEKRRLLVATGKKYVILPPNEVFCQGKKL